MKSKYEIGDIVSLKTIGGLIVCTVIDVSLYTLEPNSYAVKNLLNG